MEADGGYGSGAVVNSARSALNWELGFLRPKQSHGTFKSQIQSDWLRLHSVTQCR